MYHQEAETNSNSNSQQVVSSVVSSQLEDEYALARDSPDDKEVPVPIDFGQFTPNPQVKRPYSELSPLSPSLTVSERFIRDLFDKQLDQKLEEKLEQKLTIHLKPLKEVATRVSGLEKSNIALEHNMSVMKNEISQLREDNAMLK